MITKVAGTEYETPVVGARWYKFLDEIFDGDTTLIEYVQKVLGYALTDVVREQHFWLSKGNGGNGKTMLFERTAETKFKAPFNFHPRFKMVLDTNSLPTTEEVGDAMTRRLRVIPFNPCFIKGQAGCKQPGSILEDTLKEELPAILRWLVEGCLKWQAGGLNEPESVLLQTRAYREDNDDLAEFLEDMTVREPGATLTAAFLACSWLIARV